VDKAPNAFRTISEVAQELEIPQHVLRFWESRFREIKPMKRGGGRRYYRPEDVALLRGIRHLLYGEGYTIRGVQRLLREQGLHFVQNVWQPGAPQPAQEAALDDAAEAPEPAGAIGDAPDPRLTATRGPAGRPDISHHEPAAIPRAPEPGIGLTREETQKLQAALNELEACRRLLDTALPSNSSAG
jgi:DNA-binding transcriptional MerR regulator